MSEDFTAPPAGGSGRPQSPSLNGPLKASPNGVSMIEYTLSTFLLVACGTVFMMAANLSPSIAQTVQQTEKATLDHGVMRVDSLGRMDSRKVLQAYNPTLGQASKSGEEQICSNRMICINVPILRGGELTDLSGVDGNQRLHQMAYVLQGIATRIQEVEGDTETSQMVTELARRAHVVGDVYANEVETYCGMNAGDRCTIGEIGHNQYENAVGHYAEKMAEVNTFMAANPQRIDPLLQDVIQLESQEIYHFSSTIARNMRQQKRSGLDIYNLVVPAVSMVKQDANTICQAGGDLSQCYHPEESDKKHNGQNNDGQNNMVASPSAFQNADSAAAKKSAPHMTPDPGNNLLGFRIKGLILQPD